MAEEYRDEAEEAVSEEWYEDFVREDELVEDVKLYILHSGLTLPE